MKVKIFKRHKPFAATITPPTPPGSLQVASTLLQVASTGIRVA